MGAADITERRKREIAKQLIAVIYLLCKKQGKDVAAVFDMYTNMTEEEKRELLKDH